MEMGRALQGASQSRTTSKHRILTTAYLHDENLPMQSRPNNFGGGVHPTATNNPGEDGIPADIYKKCLDSLGPCLHGMITSLVV